MAYGAIELAPMQALGYAPAPAPMTRLLAWPTDPATASYAAASLAPAGWFGNLIGGIAPVAGRAIGGNVGQAISTIGGLGRYLPFDVDPVAAAYANGALEPAGWFGNLISGIAPVAGRAIGGNAGQAISTIGGLGRYLPFDVDPTAAAYANSPLVPQGLFGSMLGNLADGWGGRAIGGLFGGSGSAIGSQIGSALGGLAGGILPFHVDPLTAAYASGRLT